jgi:hypothetical protein
MTFDFRGGFLLNPGVIAEAAQPLRIWLAAKPCHLPLGVIPVGLLSSLQGLRAREFST